VGCVIELQSTVDIVIGKTLNVAYFLNFYLTQTCTFLGGPSKKKLNYHYASFVCPYVLSVVTKEWKAVKISNLVQKSLQM